MYIELLWLIPVFAISGLLWYVIMLLQNNKNYDPIAKEVEDFNNRTITDIVVSSEDKIDELRDSMKLVHNTILKLQEQISAVRTPSNSAVEREVWVLKDELKRLQSEYYVATNMPAQIKAPKRRPSNTKILDDTRLFGKDLSSVGDTAEIDINKLLQ